MTEPTPSRLFWPALAAGSAIMLFGLIGLVANATDTNPVALLAVLGGFVLLHDLVVAPLTYLAGAALARRLPVWARGPVKGASALTAIVIVLSVPLIGHFGRRPGNSSTLPLSYGRNVAIIVGLIWLGAGLLLVWRRRSAAITS